jgi:hypothetical protein
LRTVLGVRSRPRVWQRESGTCQLRPLTEGLAAAELRRMFCSFGSCRRILESDDRILVMRYGEGAAWLGFKYECQTWLEDNL